jgi:hypothetical protein
VGHGVTPEERRIRRLLRWYPPSWRTRYGEEFAELLLAELAERPSSWRRTANLAVSGLLARCTAAGLTSHQLSPAEQIRSGLATLGCALSALFVFGLFILAQLAMGWQWAATGSRAAAAATVVMAVAAGILGLLALAAAAPVGWLVIGAVVRDRDRLRWPAALAALCAVLVVSGARHFENGWPGTGGAGVEHGLVPGGLAAFGWASTLSVSAYWAHPGLWAMFPAAEMTWMVLSPLAWMGLVAGCVMVVRRLEGTRRLLRYLAAVGAAAVAVAVAFLAGAATWVLARGSGQAAAFRPGVIDTVSLLIMAATVVVALRAAAGVRQARLALAAAG